MTITLTDTIKSIDARLSEQELDKKYTGTQLREALLPQVGITELLAYGRHSGYPYYNRGEEKLRSLSYSNKPELIRAYQEALQDIVAPEVDRPTPRVRIKRLIEFQGKGCNGQKVISNIRKGEGDEITFDTSDSEGYSFTTTITDLKALIGLMEEDNA